MMRRSFVGFALLAALILAGCGSTTKHQSSLFNMATLEANVVQRLSEEPNGKARVTSATCIKTGETTATCGLSYAEGASYSEDGPQSVEVDIAPDGQSWKEAPGSG
jgi:outer membrane murein-binding lipoprotein Lpp